MMRSADAVTRTAPLILSSVPTVFAMSSRQIIPSTIGHLIRSRSARDVRIVRKARRCWASRQFSAAPVE